MRTGTWQLLLKETDGAQHQTCVVSSLQLVLKQTVYRGLGHIRLYARRPWNHPECHFRLWQQFQDDRTVSRFYSIGRTRVTNPNEDLYLAVTAKRKRQSTASDLSRQFSSASFKTDRVQTLRYIGLYARRPVRCVLLTTTHCRLRLTWSKEHALWTAPQWPCGMFSDESRTDLHAQSVTTGHIYRDVILEQHVRLFGGAMGAEFLFMDDNTRPHHANIVEECLQSVDVTRMHWPAYSPDSNPIEHVWYTFDRRIPARQPTPTCLLELRRTLLDEWCNIPQDQIDNLILSMSRRCKVCIASSGSHTPY
ncbi:transposable element Tcb1 transposase [Trichonephila clavipes]|uniref:Transposable element Tcb1 transposase n=1 Tax=Trichonephila clavipes TaxID=2585209 RepID=A0A8X6VA04_TRICX|nr:transposable element Tcb1 transposase [Trichonephila clavipes]